ncbi:MAG: type II toxin-antitoxin system RelE/ParE family toxin [Clostridia bacterium]|nr:type II toxin-antitoxin system RelE/ParE family toxin [Clostridia bacterium]
MMLQWTPKAASDLAEIKRYIGQDDPNAALKLIRRIVDRAERLPENPESGPELREKRWPKDRIRYLTIDRYLLFYRIDAEAIRVIRVLHSARQYSALLYEK